LNIGFLITARLKSTRLPKKILLDLNGKSVIDRVIERAKMVKGINRIILCTSTNKQDDELCDYAFANDIDLFRGSEDDVLTRLYDASKIYDLDAFVNITADNPLFCFESSSKLVEIYKKHNFDFINTKGLPIGLNTYLFDVKALNIALVMKSNSDTEIWGPYIYRSDFFNLADVSIKTKINPRIRITLDYNEDYKLFKKIYSYFSSDYSPDFFDLINILEKDSEILKINQKKVQIMPSEMQIAEIRNEFDLRKNKGLEFAKKIDKKLKPNFTEFNFSVNEIKYNK